MKKTNRVIAMFIVFAIVASLFTMTASAYSEVSYGSYGSDVKELQKMLNKVSNAGLVVDGDFGNGTYNAVVAFQRSCGLVADGIVGAKTWNALSAKYSAATSPASTLRIGSGSYSPGTLSPGQSYSISGTISSNYKITSVTAGVYTSSGAATSQVKTTSPNSTSYNISNLDYYIAFGSLAAGTYRFKVTAKDASGANKTLVNNQFTVKAAASTLTIGSGSYPTGTLTRGQSFSISGLVSSNYKINSITVSIHTYTGGSTTVQTKTVNPNATSYNISNLDSYIKFGSLAADSYIFKVTAKDASGAEKTLSKSFTVKSAASTLRIGSGSYSPGTLSSGQSYSISGTISSYYKITSVTVGVYTSSGAATSQVKTTSPNATSYNISNLDDYIAFGSLAAGSYKFKVTAKDASGTSKTLVDNSFTVKAAATSVSSYPEIYHGSSGYYVEELQRMLNKVINAGLSVDGDFGDGTEKAVVAFQKSCGLDADGIVGANTWNALKAKYSAPTSSGSTTTTPTQPSPSVPLTTSYPDISKGAVGSCVKKLQEMLNIVIDAELEADGDFGNGTHNAVIEFQEKNHLDADGIVGSNTWKTLESQYYASSVSILNIGSGSYPSGTLKSGTAFSISGLICSNYKINSVTVSILTYSGGSTTVQAKTVNPNTTSYNISKLDSYIKFGSLAAGSYIFKVTAKDLSGAEKTLTTTFRIATTDNFAQEISSIAHDQNNNRRDDNYGAGADVHWCGYYVRWILKNAYYNSGINISNVSHLDMLFGATDAAYAYQVDDNEGNYYGFTEWRYPGSSVYYGEPTPNSSSYTPRVGDILLIDTDSSSAGPDHLGIIIEVYADGSFLSSEGNTGAGNVNTRTVHEYNYTQGSSGIWARENNSSCFVHAVCRPDLP